MNEWRSLRLAAWLAVIGGWLLLPIVLKTLAKAINWAIAALRGLDLVEILTVAGVACVFFAVAIGLWFVVQAMDEGDDVDPRL